MAVFQYKAVTPQGDVKAGSLSAGSEADAIFKVQSLGMIPLSVDSQTLKVKTSVPVKTRKKKRLGQSDVTDLTRQLSILIGAGLPLDRALNIIVQVSSQPAIVNLVTDLQSSVREGNSLSSALTAHPSLFSDFYINFVRSAEMSGNMADNLNDLSTYLEKSKALRERLASALIYPVILVAVTLLSLGVIVVFVLPEFAKLFDDMDTELPTSTAVVMGLADVVKDYGSFFLIAGVAGYLYFRQRRQDPQWRLKWDERLLAIPLLSDLIKKIEMARLSRSLGTLLRGGVPLLTALRVAAESLQNSAMANRLDNVVDSLQEGSGLAHPLIETGVFPEFALQMIQVGEETGRLDEMLLKVADIYDDEVSSATQRMLAVMEPVLIIGLGIVIGGIVVSILVAVLSINQISM